jgi:FlaA1/EpsC-like NDP-sugar epimerase
MADGGFFMLFFFGRNVKRLLVLISDALLISASFYMAYVLRFNTVHLEKYYASQILHSLPLLLAVRLSVFILMGLYRGMWRFVGVRDLIVFVKAVTLSSGLSVGLLFILFRLENYPRSVFIIDWLILLMLIGGSRFAYRLYREGWFRHGGGPSYGEKNILIVGAGRAGELILREIQSSSRRDYNPVGFVDDDRKKHHMTIHGVKVLGYTRDIPKIVHKLDIDEIVLAIPSARTEAKRRIMHMCKSTSSTVKTVPSVGELLDGVVKISALHEIQIEDLLGREPVKLDTAAIGQYVHDKTIMITGAGGSIGSELCRQVAQFSPRQLVLYENSEFNLYQIEMNLLELFPTLDIQPIIGTILNQAKVEKTLKQFKPDVVFHAAAYKHVPLMEVNVDEALANNALGTWIVARLSQQNDVKKFVMVSTDKAVRPVNIMGASKRIAELVCQSIGLNGKTQFVTVRFGNVLNSVGSVIPLFKRQIARGGPITVTHPEIYRYFMTIPEAVQLIMQAGAMGRGNEVFVLDMGEPIKIADLARDMITLSGLEPDKDVKIAFTGLRPGEKLYEELLTEGEHIKSTLHQKIKVADIEKKDWAAMAKKIDCLLTSLQNGSSDDLIRKVKEIVPEYLPGKCTEEHTHIQTSG